MKRFLTLTPVLLMLALCSCNSTGPQPAPTTFDKLLLDVKTNTVTVTNFINYTNLFPQIVQTTNTNNVIVYQTNYSSVVTQTPQFVTQTNYVYTPKTSITDTANALGPLAGPYGTIAATVLSGVLGIFAFFKNRQANTLTQVAGSATIALQTARQVIAALPNSAAVTASFNNWLAAHQNDANIAAELAQISDQFLDPTHQATVAAGIVAQVTTPLTPPPVKTP